MTEDLQQAIDSFVGVLPPSLLKKARKSLSKTYAQGESSRSIFENEAGRFSYLFARMPATFGAVSAVLPSAAIFSYELARSWSWPWHRLLGDQLAFQRGSPFHSHRKEPSRHCPWTAIGGASSCPEQRGVDL